MGSQKAIDDMRKLLLVFAACFSLQAQTTITEPLILTPIGAIRFTGTLTITAPGMTYNSQFYSGGSQVYPIVNGLYRGTAFSLALIPNLAAAPVAPNYTVTYQPRTGSTSIYYWAVPVSGTPLTIASVQTTTQTSPGPDIDLTALAAITRTRGALIRGGASAWEGVTLGASGRYLKSDGTDSIWSSGSASGTGTCTNQFVRALNSDAGPTCAAVSLTADVSGSLPSASVGFTQSGAGAVVRTLESKAQETISVKDFGAVGDGVANDTAAIQAAIDSHSVGGIVMLSTGKYKITATLQLKKSTRLICSSMSAPRVGAAEVCVIDASSITNAAAIRGADNGANSSVENVYVKGPIYSAATASEYGGAVGIYAGYFASNFRLDNVYVTGFTNGIVLEFADRVILNNVHATAARTHGIVVKDSTNVVSFGSLFSNNGHVALNNPSNWYITGASEQIVIYDPLIDECVGDGVSGAGAFASVYIKSGTHITIQNSKVFLSNNGYGIRIGDGSGSPTKVRLVNVNVAPFSVGQGAQNTILLQSGSGHILENVTTDPGTGGNIADTATGTAQINVNSATVLPGSLTLGVNSILGTTSGYLLIQSPNSSLILRGTGGVDVNDSGSSTTTINKSGGVAIVGAGASTGSGVALQVNGPGLQLVGGTQPSCDAAHRGQVNVSGSTHTLGVKDTVSVCAADASDVYAWRTIY